MGTEFPTLMVKILQMAEEKELTFSAALVRLKKGDEIARASWEKGLRLAYVRNESKNRDEILYCEPNEIEKNYWAAKQEDILADDWVVVKEAE